MSINTCEITKCFEFSAAHSLPFLPKGHKCRNLHGHNYKLTVTLKGKIPDNGMLVDYAEISVVVKPIIDKCDHKNLNDIIPFHTTSENIAFWFAHQIKRDLPELHSVSVSETSSTSATVYI